MLKSPWILMPLAVLAVAAAAPAQTSNVSTELQTAQACRQQARTYRSRLHELRGQYIAARQQGNQPAAQGLRERLESLRSEAEQQAIACIQ